METPKIESYISNFQRFKFNDFRAVDSGHAVLSESSVDFSESVANLYALQGHLYCLRQRA